MLRSKTRKLPPLHALRAFEAAARRMSFKAAAEELAVTPTAVSHHIRQLEAHLGVQLFERRPRGIVLTRQGQDLYPVLREGFDGFAQAISGLRSRRLRRVVTISATVAFTSHWLLPRVSTFRRMHPGMDLRLHASDEPVDLRAGAADVAIRYGEGRYVGMKSEPLFQDRFGVVCSPKLGVRRVEDLRRHPLIHFEWKRRNEANPTWERWWETACVQGLQPGSQITLTDESQAIQAAVAGHGVALVSLVLTGDEISAGRLMVPFGPELESYAFHLVYPMSERESERVRIVREWVRSELIGSAGTR